MTNHPLKLMIFVSEMQLSDSITMEKIADILMVGVYWFLTIFWILLVANLISYLIWKPLYKTIPEPRKIMYGFLILAVILLLDSMYWALANTSRVGYLNVEVKNYFYNSWFIISIKGGFLIAAITYWITIIRTYRQIERKFETLFFTRYADQIKDAIGVLDNEGCVLYWNAGAEELYGRKREEVKGKHIKNFLVPERFHSHLDKTLNEIKRNRKPVDFRAPRLKYDNSEILVDITISPWFHENGNFGGYFGTMREVSINRYVSPDISELFKDENALSEKSQGVRIFEIIKEVYKRENKQYMERKKIAVNTAIFLLLLSCILISLTLFFDKSQNIYLVIGAIVSISGEILPLRYLIKNRANNFKEIALNEVLSLESNIGEEEFKELLKLIDEFGRTLASEMPDTGIIARLFDSKLSLPSKTDKKE